MIGIGESQSGPPAKHELSHQTKNSAFFPLINEKIKKGESPTDAIKAVRDDLKAMQDNPLFEVVRQKRIEAQKKLLEASKSSEKDALTEVYARGYVMGTEGDHPKKGKLEELVERTLVGIRKGEKLDLSVAMLDIDHFKKVNDIHGHAAGDKVLRETAKVILKNLRDGDIVGRYGGEEFIIILPDDLETAHQIIERVRLQISQIDFSDKANYPDQVTASFGLTNLTSEGGQGNFKEIGNGIVARADHAMYLSKQGGRNKTTIKKSIKSDPNLARVNKVVEL